MQVLLAGFTYFLILSSYYVLRPVRDEMGVQTGTKRLPWLFTATFVATLVLVPLWGWIVGHLKRRALLPATYGFIILNLIAFAVVLNMGLLTRSVAITFFVWASVINLFVVSLFWSSVSDVFTTDQSHRLYGYVAAGGSVGALTGPAITASLAETISTSAILTISAVGFGLATLCAALLAHTRRAEGDRNVRDARIGGTTLAGIGLTFRDPTLRGIAIIIICYTTVSTFLYFEQTSTVGKTIADSGERTAFFASVDLLTNGCSVILQLLATAFVVRRFGVRTALSFVPALILVGFLVLGFRPEAVTLALLQMMHRSGDHSFVRPGREMLYTTVDPESRYKAKQFIDTTIYRGNDAVAGWITTAIRMGGLYAIIAAGVVVAAIWSVTGYRIGRRHDERNVETVARPA